MNKHSMPLMRGTIGGWLADKTWRDGFDGMLEGIPERAPVHSSTPSQLKTVALAFVGVAVNSAIRLSSIRDKACAVSVAPKLSVHYSVL